MVTIRLMRIGKRNRPYYRIVAQNARDKANGAYLELLGSYDPIRKISVNVNIEKIKTWRARGAGISARVASLLKQVKASQT